MVADLLDAIVARQPQLAIVVALVDPVLPADAPVLLGGVCADWEQGVHRVLEQAAQQTLKRVEGDDELAPGDRLLELPSVIRDRVPAWTEAVESTMARGAGFRVAGLHVSDRSLTPEAIETTLRQLLPCADDRRRQSWSPWLKGAGMALMVLVLVAMAAGIWWTVDETGRRLMRDSTIVLQAEAATTTQVSGAGLAALARIVRMIDQRDTRLLLVPSSWSKGLDDVLRTRVRDAIRTLLLDPVRRQFEARLAEIEAQVEALGHEQGHSVLQQAASLLRELVALQHRNERFRLAAAGTLRSQWQTLLGESTPAASLAWMDTPVGGTLMAEAVARYDWTLQDVEPIAARILATAVMAAENSQAAFDTRLIAIGRLSARVERAVEELTAAQGPVTGKNHNPLAEIAELLYGVRAEGEAVAAGRVKLRAAIDDLTALRPDTVSSGVLRPSTWRDVVAKLSMIRDREQMALRQQSVNSLGPLFGPDGRVAPEVVSAPDVLKQAVDNGFIDHRERRMPDVGALAMLDGVPDAALISAAAERLRWLQRWVETSALQLSSTIRQPVSSFVVSRAVRASAIDIAEAYGNAKAVSGGVAAFPADAAADLTFALSQIGQEVGADGRRPCLARRCSHPP